MRKSQMVRIEKSKEAKEVRRMIREVVMSALKP
jgi:hypothetical protein